MNLTKKVASFDVKKRNILIPYVIIMILLYMYCFPESQDLFINVLIGSIIGAIWSYFILLFPMICKLIWEDLNMAPFLIKLFLKFAVFGYSISLTFASILMFLSVFTTKNFDVTSIFLPTLFVIYNSIKVCKQLGSNA